MKGRVRRARFLHMPRSCLPLFLAFATIALAQDDNPVVFKSDVSLTRIDAQVVDHEGRAVTGLDRDDFIVRVNGQVLAIRNFASESMPIDILLLLDVSGSMQPHVERIASAAQQALRVLAPQDRIAIMVFDTSTRVRLPFRSSHAEVNDELHHLLRSESFDGGTLITRAMLNAASYLEREARKDARRAIVILTDDQTQDAEDERRVEAALSRADAVLSFLQAPYEVPGINGGSTGGGRPHGTWGSSGSTWPSGGGWPGGGGIGFPGGGPLGGGRPGVYGGGDRSHSAGTANIARDSGGDTMQVHEASALEDTLARLRQRYALYFYFPEGANSTGRASNVQVDLTPYARGQYQQADVRYRQVYMAGAPGQHSAVVSRVQQRVEQPTEPTTVANESATPRTRRVAVNEDSTPQVNTIDPDADRPEEPGASTPAQAPVSSGSPSSNRQNVFSN